MRRDGPEGPGLPGGRRQPGKEELVPLWPPGPGELALCILLFILFFAFSSGLVLWDEVFINTSGLGSPRSRRSPQHRFRRRRMPEEGMLVQIDGSHHPWLEDRGPKLTLLIAVDDATSTVAQAVFRTGEDTRGYLVLLEGLIRQWGIPLALYSDRHSAFKYNARQKPVPVESG